MHKMVLEDKDIQITYDRKLGIYRLEAFGEMIPISPKTLWKWASDLEKRIEFMKASKDAKQFLNDKLIELGKLPGPNVRL